MVQDHQYTNKIKDEYCLNNNIQPIFLKGTAFLLQNIYEDVGERMVGDIDIIDADKHIFKINDWNNNDVEVVIYSKEDLEVIEGNMIDHLYTELSKSKISLTDNISIELKDLVKEEVFENKMFDIFTPEFLIKTISDLLGGEYQKEDQGKYFIWII